MAASGQKYALGRETKAAAIAETTLGTYVVPTAAGGFRILSGSVTIDETRNDRIDARQTRSLIETITGMRSAEWELSTYLLPRGGATPPDVAQLLLSAFGVETIGGSDVVYSLSPLQDLPSPMSLSFSYSDLMMVGVRGAVVEEFGLDIPGTEEPKLNFSGRGFEHVKAGSLDHDGASATLGASTITVANPEELRLLDDGTLVQIGTDDNGGSGYTVSNVDPSAGTFDISPTLVSAQTGNTTIAPFFPWDHTSLGGNPVPSILGQLDIGSDTDVLIQSANLSVVNNWKSLEAAFNNTVVEHIPGFRAVTGEITFWGRTNDIKRWAFAQDRDSASNGLAVQMILGSGVTGEAQAVVDMPKVQFDFGSFEVPESEEASFTLPFRALSTDYDQEDEITLTFQNAA